MGLSDDERGQAIQVGFILIFGVLVISFASYQAFVVPGQNSEVEFNHNQQVQGQLQELRNAIVSSVGRATTVAVAVDLGTTYPSRLVAANPPAPSGALRTIGTTDDGVNLSVNNAVAQNRETADYWNGNQRNFTTGVLEYRPNYNEYNDAPRTVYENTLLYNQFRSANRTVTGQSLVDGNEITLVALNGSLNAARSTSVTVDVQSVSTPDGATVVEPESGENLTVSVVSRLSAEQWNETLADEFNASVGDDRYVTDVTGESRGDGLYDITLTFEKGETYRLRMAKVGVGSGVSEETAAYLTEADGASKSVQQGENVTVTLSTRDRFGNPVSGVSVTASASAGDFVDSDNKKNSEEDGSVTFTYTAGSSTSTGTQQLNFSLGSVTSPFDAGAPGNVSTSIEVTANGGNDSGGVGDGSVTNYSEDSTSETFSSANGRWVGITCTDQLLLSDGQPASKPGGDDLKGDIIRLSAFLNDSTGESYTMDIKLARATDGSWNNKEVVIYDGNGNSKTGTLTAAAAARIYENGETDMLELSNYDGPGTGSGSFSDFIKQIRALEDDAPVVWQTARMTGRVEVALECDSPPAPPVTGVETVNGTTPDSGSSALQFDMQVASGESRTVTDLNITRPGNQNSAVESPNNLQLKRGSGKEVRLTVSDTSGVNQSGELDKNVKLDGTEYPLDTNAVFSDGAVLSVDMGDLDGGNIKWTYNLVDKQSNADVVVTFYFQDGTQFQAYLQVNNISS